jgi:hypothetical protein
MTLRSGVSYGGLLLSDLRLQLGAEEREGAIPLDALQPGSMSTSAAAGQRCFWSEVRQWSTSSVRCPTSALMDSRQLAVFRLVPKTPKTPRRWRVRVSSKPSSEGTLLL